jgi:hypothetical protein
VAVLPAAEDPGDPSSVVSHPGITYGGLVHNESVRGDALVDALTIVSNYLTEAGYSRLRYKATPSIYHRRWCADDLRALFQLGAECVRCELSAAIDLASPAPPRHGRLDARKRAARAGVQVFSGWGDVSGFWRILEENLSRRYGAAPTHSLVEIEQLHELFPDAIELIVAKAEGELVSGAVMVAAGSAFHLQYSGSNEVGRRIGGLDAVLTEAIDRGQQRSCRFFSFGTSSINDGRAINQNLYDFKLSFGAGSFVQEHYEISLPL